MTGGIGNDVIAGGTGTDYINGGDGKTHFKFGLVLTFIIASLAQEATSSMAMKARILFSEGLEQIT